MAQKLIYVVTCGKGNREHSGMVIRAFTRKADAQKHIEIRDYEYEGEDIYIQTCVLS